MVFALFGVAVVVPSVAAEEGSTEEEAAVSLFAFSSTSTWTGGTSASCDIASFCGLLVICPGGREREWICQCRWAQWRIPLGWSNTVTYCFLEALGGKSEYWRSDCNVSQSARIGEE